MSEATPLDTAMTKVEPLDVELFLASANENVLKVELANALAKGVIDNVFEKLLTLRACFDAVPDEQKGSLKVTSDDMDRLLGVLQPLHVKQ